MAISRRQGKPSVGQILYEIQAANDTKGFWAEWRTLAPIHQALFEECAADLLRGQPQTETEEEES